MGNIMVSVSIKQRKSEEQILAQIDRIYRLYGQGYGSNKMIEDCDAKVYVIISSIKY